MTTKQPPLPRTMHRALADLCRFGRLERFGDLYAAHRLHLPQLGHEPKVIEAMVREGFARPDDAGASVAPTDKGRREQANIEATREGAAA